MLCKLAFFYKGYKIEDLAELPKRTLNVMWECITIIEAQEQLKQLTVSDWANMKKNQREKLHKELYRQAFPSELKPKNYVSLSDIQKVLGK